jgi:adenylate cyclase
VATVSAQELAELVPCSLEYVQRLADLRVLAPLEDGLFQSSDVHVVRLMTAFEEAGIPLEDVARGVTAGDLSFPLGSFLPEPERLTATYAELAARLGCSPELLRRLSSEFGLPPPADDRVREEDAAMLTLLLARLDLASKDELSRFARLYGGTVRRMVDSGLQFFDRAVRQRVGTFEVSDEERDRLVYERAAGFTELVSNVVPWLQRRHREHAVLDYIVAVTEGFMEERGIMPRQSRQPPAIAFLDLTGYTTLAEERGDEAAAELAASLASIVQEAAQARRGRPVKWLGDGVMFHFSGPQRSHPLQPGAGRADGGGDLGARARRDQCGRRDRAGRRLLRQDGQHRSQDRRLCAAARGAGERRRKAKRRGRRSRFRAHR